MTARSFLTFETFVGPELVVDGMDRRVLVPLDGQPLAETALPLARVISGALGADIHLLRVIPQETKNAEDAEARALSYLGGIAAGPGASTRVLHGHPGECIVQDAAAQHVACVVMTSHARCGMRRAVLGSVAEYVVAHSAVPTVLTRQDVVAPRSLRTLLLAVDATCAAPLSTVKQFAQDRDVRVVLLRVVDPRDLSIWQWQHGATLDEPQLVLAAKEQLEDVAARLRSEGTSADAHVSIGERVAVIDAFAERIDADLIVMASHARTGAARAVEGSVTDAVMRTARRPVLVCRLVPPPPHQPNAADVARATRYLPPPLVPQSIPEPPDGVRHRQRVGLE